MHLFSYFRTYEEAWKSRPNGYVLNDYDFKTSIAEFLPSKYSKEYRFEDRFIYLSNKDDYAPPDSKDPAYKVYSCSWEELQRMCEKWKVETQGLSWSKVFRCSFATAEANYGQVYNSLDISINFGRWFDEQGEFEVFVSLGSVDDLDYFMKKRFKESPKTSDGRSPYRLALTAVNRLKTFLSFKKELDLKELDEYLRSEGFSLYG